MHVATPSVAVSIRERWEDWACWSRALTLSERARCLPRSSRVAGDVSARKARWLKEPPYGLGVSLQQRLHEEGIDEAAFDRVLATPSEFLPRPAGALDWVADLKDAYSQAVEDDRLPAEIRAHETTGFLVVAEPLIAQARRRTRAAVNELADRHTDVPLEPDVADRMLLSALIARLTPMLLRTMVLELHVARLQDQLEGDSPEARFHSFLELLADPDRALALLQEYPVLARQLHLAARQTARVSIELLTRFAEDWREIYGSLLGGRGGGKLSHIHLGAGDTHRGGRSVALLTFGDGSGLVYKPRSLEIDRHFQHILRWANERGFSANFRPLAILDCGRYGWVEFIHPAGCETPEQAKRFFVRQGGNLALLYALCGSDVHHENVLAAGEHPMLIDLETLFVPEPVTNPEEPIERRAAQVAADSVLGAGLLPMRVWGGVEKEGVDISGLVDVEGTLTPDPVPVWESLGSDQMRLERKRMPMSESANLPRWGEEKLDVCSFADALLAGFDEMYRLLMSHRDELVEGGGILDRFAADETRVVLRMSRSYGNLLVESFHPDVLRDALDRDRLFDRLWAATRHQPELAPLVAGERSELSDGDLPTFTTRPQSRDLWNGCGQRFADFFPESGLERVRRRLTGFSEDDLARQRWYILASLATRESVACRATTAETDGPNAASAPCRQMLLRAACDVGDRLKSLAIRHGDQITWNGLVFANRSRPHISPLAIDLYEGIPGVVLFLAWLGKITGNDAYTDLAEGGVNTMLNHLDRLSPQPQPPGAFYGLGGVVYSLLHLGSLWRREDLLDRADLLVPRIADGAEADDDLDIIAGSAGAIAVLVGLDKLRPSQAALRTARRCGDRLVDTARVQPVGRAWAAPAFGDRPLTGASHGAAGIAWALLQLAAADGDERYRRLAIDAIAYERSQFDAGRGNWSDHRELPEDAPQEAHWGRQWCHGAPGIGLVRALGLRHFDDGRVRGEIAVAARTTVESGFGYSHCLCHGDLGNLECLATMTEALGDQSLKGHCEEIAGQIMQSIRTSGWICGVPRGIETPGLMNGLAGIGYGLLRLAEPDHVPSVLALELPPIGKAAAGDSPAG